MRIGHHIIFTVLVLVVSLNSCGGGKEEPKASIKHNRPPVVTVLRISPLMPTVESDLTVEVDGADPDGDKVSYLYSWSLNGRTLPGVNGPRLPSSKFEKGDTIVVVVTPHDGKVSGRPRTSKPVEIKDAPPRVAAVSIGPKDPTRGTILRAAVEGEDPDGDDVRYIFQWLVNGSLAASTMDPSFDTSGLRRGDRVKVRVVPNDGVLDGRPTESEDVVLQNAPPMIVSSPPEGRSKGHEYRYLVKAIDPDGDPLSFRLRGAVPPGMKIDSRKGLLVWRYEKPPSGPVKVEIEVVDGHGGVAIQRYEVSLTPP